MQIDVERLKSTISIQDILADAGVTLKRGRCRCPLHQGQNATSFSVSNGFFHCFSCAESGDVIALTQKLYGLGFKEAVDYLGKKAGLSPDTTTLARGKLDRTTLLMSLDQSSEKSLDNAFAFLEKAYVRILKLLDQELKNRKIDLAKYYREEQWVSCGLEDLDDFQIARNYETNMRRKEDAKRSLR